MAAGGNNRSRLLLVILLVTSLFLITLDLRGVNITKNSRSATQSFLAPIQRGVSDLFSPVGNFFSDIKNFGKTKSELKELKKQYLVLLPAIGAPAVLAWFWALV